MPDLDHNRIQRPFPVYAAPELGGGDYAFFMGSPWGGNSPDLGKDYYRSAHQALGPSEGLVNIKRKPDEGMSDSDADLLDSLNRAGGQLKSEMSSPESMHTLQHEMRHAWTLGDSTSKLTSLDEDPVTRMLHEKVDAKEEDSPKSLFSSMRGPENKIEAYHPAANHGLSKPEQIGWLSGLQHELYGARGRRLETPEEADTYLRRMANLPENEFEKEVAGFKSDSARGLRHLRVLKHGTPELWEAEGAVEPDAATLSYRENPARLPRSGWLGPLSGKAIPFTGEKVTKPNPYNQGKEIAPELLEQYIEWLSKLAPALVSTQNENQNIMKTANYSLQDMTKEADIGQLLSGLGGQASSFINNMPSNPMWQNGLAGGGSSAILMLLLNLLTGNKLGRGMLPAMLAGGALGAGMPALYNYMNRPGGYGFRQDESKSGPPKPIPDMGPPGPNQMQDAVGRIHTLTPLQIRQRDRAAKEVAPGTLRGLWNEAANDVDEFTWDHTGPVRGVASKVDEAAKNVKKHGLMSGIIDTPYTGALTDPYESRKYSAPDFR